MHRSPVIENSFVRSAALLCLLGLPGVASAHSGPHPGGDLLTGFLHPFTGLDHFLVAVSVGLWSVQFGRKAMWILAAAFPAAMMIGAAFVLADIRLPLVEPMIAASVVLLGLAVASGWRLSVASGATLIALFAIFHGYTHAAEAPASGSEATYAIGLLTATVALQLLGMAAGLRLAVAKRAVRHASGLLIAFIGAANVLI